MPDRTDTTFGILIADELAKIHKLLAQARAFGITVTATEQGRELIARSGHPEASRILANLHPAPASPPPAAL